MHELHCDGAFTDGRGASLDGVEANVAGDEYSRDAGFQQIWLAFELPGSGRADFQVGAGEDKAFAVCGDVLGQPVSLGRGADEDEDRVRRARFLAMRSLECETLQA